ncbi:MAG: phosphomannomutase/phosphoglucomutase, partial [Gammaproteobacteria bacterium]|nr:phosphomannomutase/phosphoglucomutase [Gammaproteobacteria bacterium]
EVVELYCEVDGNFPNHHPDPTIVENLQDLIRTVKAQQADIGLALDGGADRLGVVTNTGKIIWPDRQMMLYAIDLLKHKPGSEIVYDVKCTRNLAKVISEHGGKPIMYRTGHSILKQKMLDIDSPLAGEMSGHVFFQDGWFGFDDGIYVGARLLGILSHQQQTADEIFAALPDSINTPELKLPMAEENKASFMQRLLTEAEFPNAERITIDGLRLEFKDSWGLIRPSNTSPYLILRFEADDENAMQHIQSLFRRELLKLEPGLKLPF